MLPTIILCLKSFIDSYAEVVVSNRDVSKAMYEDTLLDEEVVETHSERVSI